MRLILASGSPRRRALLAKMGYTFETCSPDVDENIQGAPKDIVSVLARRKAYAAAREYADGIIIASDTLVSLDNIALGKPKSPEHAVAMLRSLSGRAHQVYTGVCVLNAATKRDIAQTVRTDVWFRALSDAEIQAYVATGDPMDKAGAYGIQGAAGAFVEKLNGSLENVMGFPVAEVEQMLQKMMR